MSVPRHTRPGALAGFHHSGFFVLRTPLLAADGLHQLLEDARSPSAPAAELETAWSRDMSELRERVRRQMGRPEVREALFLASSDLYEECSRWLDDADAECPDRMLRSLMRYLLRMSARCTPFGLFASTSVGSVGDETRLDLGPEPSFVRRTRLDMGFVLLLVEAFLRDPAVRSATVLRKNTSLQIVAGRAHYIATRLEQGYRRYVLESAELDEALAEVLEVAGPGKTRAEIAAILAREDIDHAEAAAYVDSLIDAQVLVPDLQPSLTGPGGLAQLMEVLRRAPESSGPLAVLESVSTSLSRLDDDGLGAPASRYREVEALCRGLSADSKIARLFQVDLGRVTPAARLDASVVDHIGSAVEILLRIADPARVANGVLADFRTRFVERFGEREIPLLEALDEEVGVGFGAVETSITDTSPLLQGLALSAGDQTRSLTWKVAQEVILPRLGEALASGGKMIDLTEADFAFLPAADVRMLPDALVVSLSMTDGGKGVELRGLFGPSGARMLGRFCHLDERLLEGVRRHIREEERLVPGAVFAEIVHLPEGRIGNVLARPVLRSHEIPFLGRSGTGGDREILPDDLLVSVRGERIVLRSRRLGREIIPRMSTAHNAAAGSLAPYRFLCRLQNQHCLEGLNWSWGPLEPLPFLPGVRFGRVLLSRPLWRLDRKTIQMLERARGAGRFAAVRALREERRMGRFVGVVDGDNVLPVDFDNVLSVDTFVDLIAGREIASLEELDLSAEGLMARGEGGGYAHEILLPLVRRSAEDSCEARPAEAQGGSREPGVARRHGPGSDWTYAKIYTDRAMADRLLREHLPPLVTTLRDEEVLDRWFFIRYFDPESHLRVRFKARPGHGDAVRVRCDAFLERLLSSGATWRTQLDTYDPETIRYGGTTGIDLSERLFETDSDFVLEVLALASGGDLADERWRLCLVGVDRLLRDFGYDLGGRHQLIRSVAQDFDREFGIEKQRRHAVREKLRKHRVALSELLAGRPPQSASLGRGLEILERRSALIEPIATRIKAAERDGLLTCTVSQIVTSLIHMNTNRLLRSAHRAHEAMIYHFLERLYESERARRTAPAEVVALGA